MAINYLPITIIGVGNFPQRKGCWIRAAAAAIDLGLLFIAYVIVVAAVAAFESAFTINVLGDDDRIYSLVWYILIIAWLSIEIFLAATPGKLILGLCIANANGTPAPRSMRFHRWITKTWCFWLSAAAVVCAHAGLEMFGAISYTLLLAGCLAAANDYRQTWHDEIAHTAVFRRRDIYGQRPIARDFSAIPPRPPPTF